MQFKYLVKLSSDDGVEKEVEKQVVKAAIIAGCLGQTVWSNKNIKTKVKSRIYKTRNSETKRLLQTSEMRVLRRIAGMDENTNESIRGVCGVKRVNDSSRLISEEVWGDPGEDGETA